jgi:hypothetical protein
MNVSCYHSLFKIFIIFSFIYKYFIIINNYLNITRNNNYIDEIGEFLVNKNIITKYYIKNINLYKKLLKTSYLLLLFIISLYNPITLFNFFIIFIASFFI